MKKLSIQSLTIVLIIISTQLMGQCRLDYSNYAEVFKDDFIYSSSTAFKTNNPNWRFDYPFGKILPNNCYEDVYYDEGQVTILPLNTNPSGVLRLTADKLSTPIHYQFYDSAFTTPVGGCSPSDIASRYINLGNGNWEKIVHYKSGMIYSIIPYDSNVCGFNYNGFAYGLFEIKCKFPQGNDTWPAFWLHGWQNEFDIFEGTNDTSYTSNIHDFTRYNNPSINAQCSYQEMDANINLSTTWHTYSLAWTPTKLTFFFDGRELRSVDGNQRQTYNCKTSIIANLAMNTWSSTLSTYMDIDYIRVLKPLNNNYSLSYKSSAEFMNTNVTELAASSNVPLVNKAYSSIATNPNNPNEIFYRGSDDYLYQAQSINGQWTITKINYNYNAPMPAAQINGDLKYNATYNILVYKGKDSRIQFFGKTNGQWYHWFIDDFWNTSDYLVSPDSGSLDIAPNGDIIYKGYSDKKIHRFTYINNDWQPFVLNHPSNYAPSLCNGNISVGIGNQIFYQGTDNRLQTFWLNNGVYTHSLVDNAFTSSTLVSTKSGAITLSSSNDIYFVGQDDLLHLYTWVNNTWQHSLIPYTYGGPLVGYLNGDKIRGNIKWDNINNRLVYNGYDSRVQIFAKSGSSWYHRWIDDYWNTPEYCSYTISNNSSYSPSINLTSDSKIVYQNKDAELSYFKLGSCEVLNPTCAPSLIYSLKNDIISEESVSDDNINLYPNPVDSYLNIDYFGESATLILYTIEGSAVINVTLLKGENAINLKDISKGLYIVKIIEPKNNNIITRKIIKN